MTDRIGYDAYRSHPPHRRVFYVVLLAIAAAALIAQSVKAAVRLCDPAEEARRALRNSGEVPILRGLASTGELFEVWSSINGATWTATAMTARGHLCIMIVGTNAETTRTSGIQL